MSQEAASPLPDIRAWLEEEYDSDSTVDTYMQVARKFHEMRGIPNLSTETVTRFITQDVSDLSDSSRNMYRGALPAIEKAARAFGHIDTEVDWPAIPAPSPDDPPKRALPPEDVDRLLQAATRRGVKAEAIVRLAYDLALRVREVSNIEREDIDLENNEVRVDRVKNGPEQTLPINQDTADALNWYLESDYYSDQYRKQRTEGGDVFPSTDVINTEFRKVAIQAGFELEPGERFGLHVLRHSRCANLLRPEPHGAGWDIQSVKEFAGHQDIQTTQDYLQFIEDEDESVVAKLKRDLDQREASEEP